MSIARRTLQMIDYSLLVINKKSQRKRHRCNTKLMICIGLCIISLVFLIWYIIQISAGLTLFLSRAITFHKTVKSENNLTKIICYFVARASKTSQQLHLDLINGSLCTHLNIGVTYLQNSSITIDDDLRKALMKNVPKLKTDYPKLKLLLWVGGGGDGSTHFADMIKTHNKRKIFIRSLIEILQKYDLDGCDLDWEFPGAYKRERQHFSQLIYEIRQEYTREKRQYILSIAVAAIEGIAYFAYDVKYINDHVDYVNIMCYDYHFYGKMTPFTGLNSPLYARHNEHKLLATLNINYSVNWWISNGLDKSKLIVGLPTYGHSFTLVNPFNTGIWAPAKNFGQSGVLGFTTYSDICRFKQNNIYVVEHYNEETCSPYLSCGMEWISYENPASIKCKAEYIKKNQLGGIMLFSLNSDDFQGICKHNYTYPLIKVATDIFKNI